MLALARNRRATKAASHISILLRAKRYADHPWMKDYFAYAASRGKSVLEVGISQGTDLVNFAEAGAVCHGLDITDRGSTSTCVRGKLRQYLSQTTLSILCIPSALWNISQTSRRS